MGRGYQPEELQMEEPVFPEKVRLLLLDSPEKHKNVKSKSTSWPFYALGAVWWAFFISSITVILILLIVMVFAKCHQAVELRQRPLHWSRIDVNPLGGSIPDKLVDTRSLLSLMLESLDNVFFVSMDALTHRASCSLESFLMRCPNKKVFLVMFDSHYSEGWFEKKLSSEYSNLVTLKADGQRLFKNSLFDGDWKANDERSAIKAQLLLLWQYGGTMVWDKVLLSGSLPEPDGISCLISPDLISCPKQCSAFVYRLILSAKNYNWENKNSNGKSLVDQSVSEFCGNLGSCYGVQRLPPTCTWPSDSCMLTSVRGLESHNWSSFSHFCPVTYAARLNPNNSIWFDVVH